LLEGAPGVGVASAIQSSLFSSSKVPKFQGSKVLSCTSDG
jgi:hypothetical protein